MTTKREKAIRDYFSKIDSQLNDAKITPEDIPEDFVKNVSNIVDIINSFEERVTQDEINFRDKSALIKIGHLEKELKREREILTTMVGLSQIITEKLK